MPFLLILFFAIVAPFQFAMSSEVKTTRLCQISIQGPEVINFTKTEERWLCGSGNSTQGAPPSSPASPTSAWNDIPLNQKAAFLRAFLQSRGYHQVEIQQASKSVQVQLGPKSFLKSLEVLSAPPTWKWQKRRYIENRPFTPETLDEFEKWAKRRLQENGYPCPTIHSQAIIEKEKFEILAETGKPRVFKNIQTTGENDLNPDILERFTAFFPGDPFDIRLLEITSNRILEEDLYLSSYYDILCGDNGDSEIVRRMIPAKPRLLSLGVGYDTESGPLFKATLKQTRLNSMADNILASLYASLIEQSLDVKHRHYLSSELRSRLHLLSQALIKREVEDTYEANTYQIASYLSYGWESRGHSSELSAGPLVERIDVVRGTDDGKTDALKINADYSATSHLFEYFRSNPQEGWTYSLNATTQLEGALSNQTIHRVSFRHQILWNLDGWDPALLILGWRGWLGSYFLSTGTSTSDEIPTNQRFYLGGDADLRGFSRKYLPRNNGGFLTVAYQGFELRTGDLFPFNLQPLLFTDFAIAGEKASQFDKPIYYDYGIGLRWASPLGTVRGSIGQGEVLNGNSQNIDSNLQFFLSYGREF